MNSCDNEHRQTVRVKRVDEVTSLDELFRHCLPAFGGAYLRRIYTILDRAIGMGCPLTLAIAALLRAGSPALNRLGRLPLHHRRRLLSRRPPLPHRPPRSRLRSAHLR